VSESPYSYVVSDHDFDARVVARSHEVPVVVDLWAPWCGPCRMLTPVLEHQVAALDGRVELATLNVDENPVVAGRLGAQSIPLVLGYAGGVKRADFVGARDARFVKAWLAELAPSPAAARVRAAEGDRAAALALADLVDDAEVGARAALLLAGALVDEARGDEAARYLDRAEREDPDKVEALRQRIALAADAATYGGEARARAAVAASGADLDARWALGCALAARGEHAGALEQFLEILSKNRKFRDDAARKAMLAIFDALGSDSDLTRDYRRRMQIVL